MWLNLKRGGVKVGFKLGVGLKAGEIEQTAKEYIVKNNLDVLIYNDLKDVSSNTHKANCFLKT